VTGDEGHAVSYKVLARGTPVWSSDGEEVGTVLAVLENEREHLFDGIVVQTPRGRRFVDAPEVARIAERRVTLALDAAAAAELPERDPKGGAEFAADLRAGRLRRLLGGGWRKR
jgi:hypothetical protein